MSTHYSDPRRESDPYALPDVWVTQLTAEEVAQGMEDEYYEFSRRTKFRIASMSPRVQRDMIDAMIEELGIKGGWCWYYCQIGCMPDSGPYGPFDTEAEAIADMRSQQDFDDSDGDGDSDDE